MNRREFLLRSTICGAALLMGNAASTAFGGSEDQEADFMASMRIIDPRQHPDKNPTASSCSQASRNFDMPTSFQSEINDDLLYRDTEYS